MQPISLAGFEISLPVVVLGVVVGSTYGLLAAGLVLVYRANRIINFAHGAVGAFSAATFGLVVTRYHVWYWVALPLALALGGTIGAGVEVGVVRRLRHVPRLMTIIATLGFAQVLVLFQVVVNSSVVGKLFPQPPGLPVFDIGALHVSAAYAGMIFLTPPVVLAVAAFLRYTRVGIAMRAASDNPHAARLAGITASRMSTLAWALAGGVSAFTAILVFPTMGFVSGDAFGPALLVRALAAAVIARMTSLEVALAAGIGLGVIDQAVRWNVASSGVVDLAMFGVILVGLLLAPPPGGRTQERGSTWAAVQGWRPVAQALNRVWAVRNLGRLTALCALVVVIALPVVTSNAVAFTLTVIFGVGIVGLSLGLITGLGGQLSFGQFAFAAIGATASYHIAASTGNVVLAAFVGGAAAAAVSVLVGLPALRIRGLMLAVTTLAFALMTQSWLLQQRWMLDRGVRPAHPVIGTMMLSGTKSYYYFALGFLVFVLWLSGNARNGGFGRILVALRDNEDAARAFTVSATSRKLQAFALAGFLAGVGGAVYGHALSLLSYANFPPSLSVNVVAMTVVGGVGILAGPLLGALYVFGVPNFVPLDSAGLAASAAGWLLLILYVPGGLASLLEPLRSRLIAYLARRVPPESEPEERPQASLIAIRAVAERPGEATAAALLSVREIRKSFGGVRAVDDVTFEVFEGETLGVIGPNGAGKTTLFELVSGFTRPDRGTVEFATRDVTRLRPEARARLGLIRSFQDAYLFPTMAVEESITLALERDHPTPLFASLVGSQEVERPKQVRTRELLALMGLEPYRSHRVAELSTGTRRIVELACMVALQPRLLLLDEPSSGIAQRESEALGEVLEGVKRHLGATLVIIEHDMPLLMGLAHRVMAMESGRVIAVGGPAEVQADPRVIESYLGTSAASPPGSGRVPARVAAGGRV
jgi:ABC-type branched-subunit amino acid transport system ATPase component/ABC-type branched-subunit amino acid transport system permease subunit